MKCFIMDCNPQNYEQFSHNMLFDYGLQVLFKTCLLESHSA